MSQDSHKNIIDPLQSFSKKTYPEIVEDILDQITKGIAKERYVFKASQLQYSLREHTSSEIVGVEGIVGGEKRSFEEGHDYSLSQASSNSGSGAEAAEGGGRGVLVWTGETRPDEGTEFKILHTFREPSGLTDTRPGSVLRTMVEAIGKELDMVYQKMDTVYRSGFIDTSSGNSLDNVAALIGVKRKPPTRAMGQVTFWRNSDPPEIQIQNETILYDGRDIYPLKEIPLKAISSVSGTVTGIQYSFSSGKDFDADRNRNSIIWIVGGARPDTNTPFSVDYSAYEKMMVPRGTIVSTVAADPSNISLFETMEEATLKKSATGRWEADVQVRALVQGQQGNVIAGAITLMPKPPIGVEHAMNRANLAGGADSELDDSLRARAKKAMEMAGKATTGSLRTALESIEGIQSPPLIRENPDGIPGLIKVVIDGGDQVEIDRVIEDTRAAGIRVEVFRPGIVLLDINVIISTEKKKKQATTAEAVSVGGSRRSSSSSSPSQNLPSSSSTASPPSTSSTSPQTFASTTEDAKSMASAVSSRVRDFVSSLEIGDDLIYNQLVSTILGVEGIHDVKHLAIDVYRDGTRTDSSVMGNIQVSEDERAYPRTVQVTLAENDVR